MPITGEMKEELRWWAKNLPHQKQEIIWSNPDKVITTDASLMRWGASCNSEQVGGRWDKSEQVEHINYLELLGAFMALRSFQDSCFKAYSLTNG